MADVSIADKLLEHGSLGISLLAAGFGIIKLWFKLDEAHKETAAVQEERVKDSQGVAAQLVQLHTTMTNAIANSVQSNEASERSTAEMRQSLEKLADEVRKLQPGTKSTR